MHKARAFFYVAAGIFLLALACVAIPRSAQAEGGYVYVTQWGSFGYGNGQFNNPYDVALDAVGNVYVADGNNDRIQVFTSSGALLSFAGTGQSGAEEGGFARRVGGSERRGSQWPSTGRDRGVDAK